MENQVEKKSFKEIAKDLAPKVGLVAVGIAVGGAAGYLLGSNAAGDFFNGADFIVAGGTGEVLKIASIEGTTVSLASKVASVIV